ncbi:MAG: Hsp33 family molecular chaperone HslO [Bdellovibrionales bacterium]|nr:Hsp33 family molecular chaperone HslO [Bdellovibrionales bacterium]
MNELRVISRYIRKYDCLLVDCDMSDYLIDYYLNAKEMGIKIEAEHDEQLKRYLACLAMHLTTRPAGETIAWTVHLPSEEPYTIFLTGSSSESYLIGRVIYENVAATNSYILHSQVVREVGDASKSLVQGLDASTKSMVENFYRQSEQVAVKVAFIENSDKAAMLVATPGHDEEWFEQADPAKVIGEITNFDHRVMRTAGFRFACNCSAEKLLPFFQSIDRETLADLYQDDQVLTIDCPRCGRSFEIEKARVFGVFDA